MRPDLILHNARIATCDDHGGIAQALAVRGDRIVAVGSDSGVLGLAGTGTRSVDLRGRFVCPGFIDCHVHLSAWALLASGHEVFLDGADSLADVLDLLAERARTVPPGAWLRGRGWDKNQWREGRFPTAADLDAVTGDIPTALPSHDGHSLWANSAAMHICGITASTPEPDGGRILRDAEGNPLGIFQETAQGLIWLHVPPYSVEEYAAALRAALPAAASLGITGVHNMEQRNSQKALQMLTDRGELTVRVASFVPAASLDCVAELGWSAGFGDEHLRLAGIKAFIDGALGSQTAAMMEPYEGTGSRGVLMTSEEELGDLVHRATEAGLPIALHAIGDRAVKMALDAYETVAEDGRVPIRHRIEHAQHFRPEDIDRCARLGVIPSVQPVHMLADIPTCERFLGARSRWAFPLRSLVDAGARIACGSDAPVEIMDPLVGFRSALQRQAHDGTPAEGWYPQERLTPAQALRGYTIDAAFAGGMEHLVGSLEVGKLADLCVLSHDLLESAPEAPIDAKVVATVVGGEIVYDASKLLP